jgi:Na+/H+ antiporter NhaD/arsenite permease-like protein
VISAYYLNAVQEYIALGVFGLVYALIIGRRKFGIPIWTAMLIGAALMVALQVIGISDAFKAVNLQVIVFLFGMFSIVSALERTGVLQLVAAKMLARAKTPSQLLMIFVVGMGILAAFLVNDTIALLGIPLAVHIAKSAKIKPSLLLLALAFGITVGSVMTPIGNPQNLLISIDSGMPVPFLTFLFYLSLPTLANLFVTYLILRVYFRKDLPMILSNALTEAEVIGKDNNGGADHFFSSSLSSCNKMNNDNNNYYYLDRQARLAIYITVATLGGFIISEILHMLNVVNFDLSIVAILGATALYALSQERTQILRKVDYSVLVFFAAMFVVTSALWQSGAVSIITGWLPNPSPLDKMQSLGVITSASLLLSQVLSNVPFVGLYNFVMVNSGFGGTHTGQWLMLAAASTIAGNLTILGAASNVIVIEAAEARGVRAFSFLEFAKVGAIITAANIAIYYLFIVLLLLLFPF